MEAAQRFRNLVDRKAFIPGFLGFDLPAAEDAFLSGQAAMYLQGDWVADKLLNSDDIGYFHFRSWKSTICRSNIMAAIRRLGHCQKQ